MRGSKSVYIEGSDRNVFFIRFENGAKSNK